MKNVWIVAALVLAGCAAAPQRPAEPVTAVTTQPPKCSGVDCERMWLDAQELIQSMTGMRLRLVTDTRLETFAPTTYGRMGATVLKYPVDGGHELRAQFYCYGHMDCRDMNARGINAFNLAFGAPPK